MTRVASYSQIKRFFKRRTAGGHSAGLILAQARVAQRLGQSEAASRLLSTVQASQIKALPFSFDGEESEIKALPAPVDSEVHKEDGK